MCRAQEQFASVFGHKKGVVPTIQPEPSVKRAIVDTPNERLPDVLREACERAIERAIDWAIVRAIERLTDQTSDREIE